MPDPASLPKVAYLTGHYPAVSHTFILREVMALRNLGLDIATISVRREGGEHEAGADERAEAARTFYVQRTAKRIWPLLAAQKQLFTRPGRYFGALKLAWQTRTRGLTSALYQLFYFAEATLVAGHLRRIGITHLHCHFAQSSASLAMLAAHLAEIPYSFTLHGPADLDAPRDWHLGTKIARARFVACISHYARSQAMRFSEPTHWPKLKIIHCGVMPALYDRPASAPNPGLWLLFVGRVSPVKGLPVLIDALAQVPDDVRLTIVGDGPDRAAIEAAARPLGDRVVFTGFQSQEEVAAHLVAADALVLPSFAEGVPVVLMEAMASRRPVICTQVAGVSELVENGVSGLIVPPGDASALAEAIRDLASDPERRRAMGEAGRETVLAEFDAHQEAARMAQLFVDAGSAETRPAPYSVPCTAR